MASNIIYTTIDGTFPIAGQDNDTQGFRDNFSIIKNNFEAAKVEIEDLQLNTARTDLATDFNHVDIIQANFLKCSEGFYNGGNVNTNTLIDRGVGSYHIYKAVGNVQFSLGGFPPNGKMGNIRVQINGDGTTRTLTFVVNGGGVIKKEASVPGTITVNSASSYKIFDFWSYDNGSTVFMRYVGQFS